AVTLATWVKPAALQPNAIVYSRRNATNAFLVGLDNGVPFIEVASALGAQRSSPGSALPVNSWHHLAVVADQQTIVLYVDGIPYSTLNMAMPALDGVALIGGDTAPAPVAPAATPGTDATTQTAPTTADATAGETTPVETPAVTAPTYVNFVGEIDEF